MDLNNPEKWSLIYSELFRVSIRGVQGTTTYYTPIPDVRVNCSSPILQVKIYSNAAKTHWQLGAWANLFCSVNSTYSMIGEQRKPCKINNPTLLQFGQPTQQIPYNLQLSFPYWLEEISLEIFEYLEPSGVYPSDAGLVKIIQGTDYLLVNPSYGSIPGSDLQISRFTLSLPFSQYEVGRFRSIVDGEIIADPLLDVKPFDLTAIFTSNRRIGSGEFNVNIRPKI